VQIPKEWLRSWKCKFWANKSEISQGLISKYKSIKAKDLAALKVELGTKMQKESLMVS